MNRGLIKTYTAGAAVAKYRIAKFGAADGQVIQAAASTDVLFGVTEALDAASGGRVDVILSGIAEIEFGGTVARGTYVTTDADGKAVAAAPGAGVNAGIIGIATVSAVSGDIAGVLLAPGRIQG